MLLFLTTILLRLPALAGWALPWAWLRRRLGGPGLGHFDGGDGAAALAALAAVSVLVNFVLPISALVSYTAVVLGWALLLVRLRREGLKRPSARAGLLALVWVVLAAQMANIPADNYDS